MQRIWKTFLLTCSLFLLTSGAIGFAAAAGDDDGRQEAVPTPRPGDRAVYKAEEIDIGPNQGTIMFDSIEYVWKEAHWIMDGDFRLHYVQPLYTKLTAYNGDEYERMAYYDAATGEPVLDGGFGVAHGSRSGGGVMGTTLGASRAEATYHADYFNEQTGECAMRTAVHQGPAPERLTVPGYCDYLKGEPVLEYALQSTTTQDGVTRYHYQDPVRPHFEVTYTSAHPFPVELTSTLSNLVYRDILDGRAFRLTLVSQQSGQGAYAALTEPAMAPSPGPTSVAPREALSFDDSGLEGTISFADAWDAALADTTEPRLADFLDAHPDAFLAAALYHETTDSSGDVHGYWYLAVTDAGLVRGKIVEHGPLDVGVAVTGALGDQTIVWDWDDPEGDIGEFIPRHQLPTTVPSYADLAARFDFFSRDGGTINRLTYALTMSDWYGTPMPRFQVGHTVDAHNDAMASFTADQYHHQIIGAHPDGTASTFWRYNEAYSPAVPLPLASNEAGARDEGPEKLVAGTWSPPTSPVVAGMGFLALIGGGLYHFWPAIKGLPFFGGFSRIRGPALLDHPARAQIVEAVKAEPGIHFQELHRRLGIARGTLSHHLRKLEVEGLLRARVASGRSCYFAPDVGRVAAAEAAVLQSPGTRKVYDVLRVDPRAETKRIAQEVGMATSTVSYHRKKLREAGLAA